MLVLSKRPRSLDCALVVVFKTSWLISMLEDHVCYFEADEFSVFGMGAEVVLSTPINWDLTRWDLRTRTLWG